jgi:predicted transcriptional regulator
MQTRRPTIRNGERKGLTLRLNHAAWRQLRQLAFDDERSAHDLLVEALNDYFEKRGKPRAA